MTTANGTSTYQDIIRSYARNVESGHADTDLTDARTRRVLVGLLNTASNTGWATADYPRDRDAVLAACIKHLSDVLWDARHLIDAAAGGPAAQAQVAAAIDRAFIILSNI